MYVINHDLALIATQDKIKFYSRQRLLGLYQEAAEYGVPVSQRVLQQLAQLPDLCTQQQLNDVLKPATKAAEHRAKRMADLAAEHAAQKAAREALVGKRILLNTNTNKSVLIPDTVELSKPYYRLEHLRMYVPVYLFSELVKISTSEIDVIQNTKAAQWNVPGIVTVHEPEPELVDTVEPEPQTEPSTDAE